MSSYVRFAGLCVLASFSVSIQALNVSFSTQSAVQSLQYDTGATGVSMTPTFSISPTANGVSGQMTASFDLDANGKSALLQYFAYMTIDQPAMINFNAEANLTGGPNTAGGVVTYHLLLGVPSGTPGQYVNSFEYDSKVNGTGSVAYDSTAVSGWGKSQGVLDQLLLPGTYQLNLFLKATDISGNKLADFSGTGSLGFTVTEAESFNTREIAQAVPDGGATAVALGLGLFGVAALRRKLAS